MNEGYRDEYGRIIRYQPGSKTPIIDSGFEARFGMIYDKLKIENPNWVHCELCEETLNILKEEERKRRNA